MRFTPTLRRGYSPSGVRRYTLPLWLWQGLTNSLLTGAPRSLADDAAKVLADWRQAPHVEGAEHIPVDGPIALIANHYQRRGLWIGFAGGILAREVMLRRSDHFSLHYTVIADLRLRGRLVPGTPWVFGRIAQIWDMVALPTTEVDKIGRAVALRRLLHLALPPPHGLGEPIGLFPEGSEGNTAGLQEALPGSGSFMALLSRGGVPLLPAGVWESGGRLYARFGPTFQIQTTRGLDNSARDALARRQAMERIAVLLPHRLQGVYSVAAAPLALGEGAML